MNIENVVAFIARIIIILCGIVYLVQEVEVV